MTEIPYDLYNLESANLVRSFSSEEEALDFIRCVIKKQGSEAVETWALWPTDLSGSALSGDELVRRAQCQ